MEDNCKIQPPLTLNCWKHHARFIKKQIKKIETEEKLENITPLLLKIGESQMDLYLGKLTPLKLTAFTKNFLEKKKVFKYDYYKQWIVSEGNYYKMITMPDKSKWALRMGKNTNCYIHIHPGRYSQHTIRVRALTLKTTIIIMAFSNIHNKLFLNLELVNSVRKKYLNAAPIKSLSSTTGLQRLLNVFESL